MTHHRGRKFYISFSPLSTALFFFPPQEISALLCRTASGSAGGVVSWSWGGFARCGECSVTVPAARYDSRALLRSNMTWCRKTGRADVAVSSNTRWPVCVEFYLVTLDWRVFARMRFEIFGPPRPREAVAREGCRGDWSLRTRRAASEV